MNLREYGREGNLETSAPSLTGIFYMQGEEYSMKKSGVLGLAVLLALAGGTAHAADVYEMEGIVVTATKMAESAEKVPASVSVVTAKEINFGYHPDQPQLWRAPLSFQLKSGDRLRIEGGNGSGKTTLLKIITGQLQPLKGTLIQANFTYVYLNQEYSIINDRNSILEQAYAFNGRNLPEHEIKIILNRYLFPASEWDKSCRKLSGGEKMRLAFCCLMISNNMPDMFILDEPTNNLDIQSIEIITATIKNYAGTVIAISHDNYFIQEIGVEQSIFLS